MSSLTERFNEMPRVVRWAAATVVVLLGFLVWDDHVRPLAEAWNRDADRIEMQVERARRAEQLERSIRSRRELIEELGPVDVPSDDQQGREALHSLVVDVVRGYSSVTNDSFNLSGGADRLPATVSARLLAGSGQGNRRLVRISGDLRFDAEPEDATAIIADLEARPEVESISLVRMLRKDGRTVGVTLTLNAWVVQSPRRVATR
jgi:hypothetical protein